MTQEKALEATTSSFWSHRQVASSTLALGSNIFLKLFTLRSSVHPPLRGRCKIFASSEFFAEHAHRAHLRFAHALNVHVHCQADVAVPQNRLNGFIVHAQGMKVCSQAAPDCVPAVPLRERP